MTPPPAPETAAGVWSDDRHSFDLRVETGYTLAADRHGPSKTDVWFWVYGRRGGCAAGLALTPAEARALAAALLELAGPAERDLTVGLPLPTVEEETLAADEDEREVYPEYRHDLQDGTRAG